MKQYSKYKNSGIDWLGNIPEHWEVKRGKDIFSFINGYAFDSNTFNYDLEMPVVRIGDIIDGKFVSFNCMTVHKQDCLKQFEIQENDLLLAMSGATVGKIGIVQANQKGYINQRVGIIRCKSNMFLYYVLQNHLFTEYVGLSSMGSAQPNISTDNMNNYIIPLPLYPEQTSIAAYLDEKTANIDRRIELLSNKIDNYKQLRRSLISQVVTRGLNPDVKLKNSGIEWLGDVPEHWEVKRVKDCFEMNPFTSFQGITQNDEISFVPMECIRMGVIEKRIEVFSKISGGSYTPFQNGDILVSKVTPCFENGNIAIADDLLNGKGLGTSEIFVFRPIKMHTKFAFYLFVSDYIKNQGCKTMKGVGGLKRITPIDFYTESIPVPSYTEQTAIAAYLDDKTAQIDSIICKCEKQIEQLSALRRSLIAEAVTGKIKVC